MANLDMDARDGALVGPRLEVAHKGIEIGTIVFDCFKIENCKLKPINYVAGYAIGIERLAISLGKGSLIDDIPRYKKASSLLCKKIKAANSSFFENNLITIIFVAEAIAAISNKLSEKQKERLPDN